MRSRGGSVKRDEQCKVQKNTHQGVSLYFNYKSNVMDSVKEYKEKQRLIAYRKKLKKERKQNKNLNKLNFKSKRLSESLIQNATSQEKHLRNELMRKRIKHQFQYPIIVPPFNYYCLDFFFASKNLAVEIDGAHHYTMKGESSDNKRTEKLNSIGIDVIRFSNYQVINDIDFVIKTIQLNLKGCKERYVK